MEPRLERPIWHVGEDHYLSRSANVTEKSKSPISKQKFFLRAEEMAQRLKVLVAPAKNLGMVPSTLMGTTTVQLQFQGHQTHVW